MNEEQKHHDSQAKLNLSKSKTFLITSIIVTIINIILYRKYKNRIISIILVLTTIYFLFYSLLYKHYQQINIASIKGIVNVQKNFITLNINI